jgi:hypothetical protein
VEAIENSSSLDENEGITKIFDWGVFFMVHAQIGPAHYLGKYGGQTITCTPYAISKLGIDRARCFLKIDEYVILCIPFQLGFKRSLFLASLSKQELNFFQRYVNGIVGLSICFSQDRSQEPLKFFIRGNLATLGQMKGRENVGLFVVDFKTTPNDLVFTLGAFLEHQDRIKDLYDSYGENFVKMTPDAAKLIGYNLYATIREPDQTARRIQIFNLSTKTIEHLEAAGAPERMPGTAVAYQLFFKKYRVILTGTVKSALRLPQGIVRTTADLAFSPELVEIIDDYWFASRSQT